MNLALTVTLLLGWSATTTTLAYAGGQMPPRNQGDGGVQEAIRFERAKDVADARQARIEAARSRKSAESKTSALLNQRATTATAGDGGVQEAVRFERAKDAADARQARIAAGQGSDNAALGSADRRMTRRK